MNGRGACCPSCGHTRAAGDDVGGLCPACLLQLGLDAQADTASPWLDPLTWDCRVLNLLSADATTTSYLAEQGAPRRRLVVLTALRARLESDEQRARATEALGVLVAFEHAHVARVIGGVLTEADAPFLVSEYVPGMPIARYCAQLDLKCGQRAALFLPAVTGIEAAHARGIVHGRLTPSRVVVMMRTNVAAPVVTEPGVALIAGEAVEPSADIEALGSIARTLGLDVPPTARRSAGALADWLRALSTPCPGGAGRQATSTECR